MTAHDIVLHGATGFVGQLVADYLARQPEIPRRPAPGIPDLTRLTNPMSTPHRLALTLALAAACSLAAPRVATADTASATDRPSAPTLASPDPQEPVHHDLRIALDPSSHEIRVVDRITLPASLAEAGRELRFVLHGGLRVEPATDGHSLEEISDAAGRERFGINEDEPGQASVPLRAYRLRPSGGSASGGLEIELSYSGTIHHPLVTEGEEYARSFSRTPGLIGEQGVVLSGSSFWLPGFGDSLVSFRMRVELPPEWDVVSQGRRVEHAIEAERRVVTWDSPEPMDEAYLIAAPFVEYSRPAGDVTAYAFLRDDDPNLAAKYLEATAQYIDMYERLIGPYPYAKFALVENFWETGYGMPSFTLLGPRIIRFPFILNSSYPHEILHNWWGNSVFVDYEAGNWCEGLTAYLADHLIKEGLGEGATYRRDALDKYRAYVRGGRDFPLTEFRSRHSSATEAVGYGKSLMLWHMLRRRVGDDAFADGLRRFYREQRFRRASFADMERAFSARADESLQPFFAQWVERTGAPQLELGRVESRPHASGGVELSVEVRQVQPGETYRLDVPVAVTIAGDDDARLFSLELDGRSGTLVEVLDGAPARVDVDPEFDLFRRLDPLEIPPTLAPLFGAERVTLVLPAEDSAVDSGAWAAFAETWAGTSAGELEIVRDDEIDALPADRAIWILGAENRHASFVATALAALDAGWSEDGLRAGGQHAPARDTRFAFVVRHPADPDLAVGWIGSTRTDALPGLARKLPHYGKYSYLGFEGAEPTNIVKGQWPAVGSPMVRELDGPAAAAKRPAREPLVRPAPVFDADRLSARVRKLADEAFEGRGAGTAGLEAAAEWIADAFAAAGLEPGGDDGTYFQSWTESDGPDGKPVVLRNVIGVLPGTDPAWQGQSVVVGAHYDHLGRGWPDAREGEAGRIHHGADDNASGVAVVLELADVLGRELVPRRTVVFAAFAGEEWGLRGSRHYVETASRWPARDALAMINLDTVGRLGENKLQVLGTGSASEWVHIVRGIGFTTGVLAESIAEDVGGSDQKSFAAAGVPAVQLFTGGHEDYHRPSDTADKIDAAGLVKVAAFTREALVYLVGREEPLTSALPAASGGSPRPAAPSGGRRASLGTLPDFGFEGPGVRIERVMPGTPAERAGLLPGDVMTEIDGQALGGLRDYSDLLKARDPGDTIEIRLVRDGEPMLIEATLVAR